MAKILWVTILVAVLPYVSTAATPTDSDLFPPPTMKAIGVCTFETGVQNCPYWKLASTATIPFTTFGQLVQSYTKKNKTNTYLATPIGGKGKAVLTTKYLQPTVSGFKAFCVSFLYQISGTAQTKLVLSEHLQGNSEHPVWTVTGISGTKGQWRIHTSQVTTTVPAKISLSATTSDGLGFVALDDISIYNGSCYISDDDSTKPYEGSSRALVTKAAIWPNMMVPYELTDGFEDYQIDMINRFFDDISSKTCLQFVQRLDDSDYVKIVKTDQGCMTNVGNIGGAQYLQLADECFDSYGILSHAFLHLVGLRHEHVRSDRDNYVNVNLQNVDAEEYKAYFTKRPAGIDTELERVPYDKQSVMHFPWDMYAIDGRKVLTSKTNANEQLGNMDGGPRSSDYQKVANLYCSGTTSRPSSRTTTPTPYIPPADFTPCTGTTTISGRTSGTVANYLTADGYYRSGESCSWRIRVSTGKIIRLEVTMLDIKSSRSCRDDSITIYDGSDSGAPVMANLCGQMYSADPFTTTSNTVFLTFSTTDDQGSGFKINWREIATDDSSSSASLSPIDCSFDSSQCSWLDYSTTTHWLWKNLDSLSFEDHTTQSDIGSYMSVDASTVVGTNKVVTMRSARILTADGYSCFTFYYRMTRNIGTLELTAVLTSGGEKSLWSSDDNPSEAYDDWARVQVPVDSSMDGSSSYRLTMKATIRRKTIGGIGVDDVTLCQDYCDDSSYFEPTDEPYYPVPTTRPRRTTTWAPDDYPDVNPGDLQDSCDFESSLCNWQQSQMSDISWTRKSGKSSPGSTYGVSYDHTKQTSSGQYLLVNGNTKGIARFDSSVVSSNSGYKCFQFYYMMYGRNVGRLTVMAIPSGGSVQDAMVLFEATGNKAAKWFQGKASVDGLTGSYTIRFEALALGQQDGDIAIDDFGFSTSNCYTSSSPSTPSPPYQPSPNQYFCDFEDGNFCDQTLQFTNDDDSDQQWRTLTPTGVSSSYGGPTTDHSTSTARGRFAALLGGYSGTRSSMTTRPYASNENNCMTFWYYMGTSVANAASIIVYQVVPGRADKQLFTARGTSTNRGAWINPQVVIPQSTADFSVRFVALSSGSRSVIAVDDIALSRNDKCTTMARSLPNQLPLARQRRQALKIRTPAGAKNSLAVQSYLQCRFGEGSFCDWTASDAWQVVSTSAAQDIDGPDDRFAHVSTGRLMVQTGNSRSLPNADMTSNITGTLASQLVYVASNTKAKQSCLHFWYKVAGWFRDLPMDTLNVYIRTGTTSSSPRRLVATFSGSMTQTEAVDAWVEKKLTLFESTNFQVIFEAMTGDSWMGSLAVDDVELRAATCPRAGYA